MVQVGGGGPGPTWWPPIEPVGEQVGLHVRGAQLQNCCHTRLKGVDVQLEL